ncbi:MAG: DUF327 family protein [Leptospiraceae bacterium]|nr:DUF327 family protein [Leptospiraceae bacterium]
MQVQITNQHSHRTATRQGRKAAKNSASSPVEKSPFQSLLEEVLPASTPQSADLQDLWLELPAVERDLLEHPSNANLDRYRQTVLQIAREVLQQNVKVRKVFRQNSRKEKVELTLLEFVNHKLRKMAEAILNPDLPAFYLLRTTSEIRGVLLDYRQ